MASAATTTQPGVGQPVGTVVPAPQRAPRIWRGAMLGNFGWWLGAVCWLIGAALQIGAQTRTTGIIGTSQKTFIGGSVLFIIASAIWVVSAFIQIFATMAETAALGLERRPGLGKTLVLASLLNLVGTIIILIGSAIFEGGGVGTTQTGGVLWIIGFQCLLVSALLQFAVSLILASAVIGIADLIARQRTWHSITSEVFWLFGLVFFVIGAVCWTVQLAAGFPLAGALLWLLGSIMWVIGLPIGFRGSYMFFVPVVAYATAVGVTSTVPGAVAASSTVGAPKPVAATTSTVPVAAQPVGAAGIVGGADPVAAPSNVHVVA